MPGRRRLFAAFAAALFLLLAAASAPAADPLAFTLRTVDNETGTRVVIEFSRKPQYEVRGDNGKVYITLHENDVRAPFKKKDVESALLEKIKFAEGFRTSEIVFYTGPEFATFSTFEMGEPFRIVLDLRRRQAPPSAQHVGPGATPPEGQPAQAPPATATPPPAAPGQAPPPAPPPVAEPRKRAAFTVVVDAGHGGEETGAKGPSGLLEKDVTLDVARRVKARLMSDDGTAVYLTRDDDRKVPLDDRTALANHEKADLFVSIHANSSRRDSARGSETYFLSYQATDDDARALAALENDTLGIERGVSGQSGLDLVLWDLAQSAFLKESSDLAEEIQDRLNDTLGVRNRGIKQAPFRVLMGATMPAVLVEIAFISSPEEERHLREAAFKDRIAESIAASIRKFRERTKR
ncbi:MAG TPA: N-acetylmuramoyl-L-alanine amidase [Candidatus Polarisedimenticolia bacterium]|jgi:N-acetylmuramoyl-L-alanine amidase|nr:N-acetylmuramoyl-L-alanine amidase [Candidatus Polarisedimenticolia bacterium]